MKLLIAVIIMAFGAGLGAQPVIQDHHLATVEEIKAHSQVSEALTYLETIEDDALKLLVELTEIEAPPFQEDARGQRFAELLKEAGLKEVRIDEVGNVIGVRPGTVGKRIVAYSAHLDTVFPAGTDVTVRFEGKRMYAPGIGDNSQGLVNALGVLKAMQHAGLQTEADVWFIGNVGEEGLGDLRGVKHLFRDDAPDKIDSLIAIDGGSAARIVYGGVGSHRYRVTFRGPGGHSWGAFGLANPHHALARAIAIFDENAPAVTSTGLKTTYSVGRIGGGTSINSIPFESWAEIDMRSIRQDRLDEIDAVLQAAVAQALEEENAGRDIGPELTVEVKRVGTRPAAPGNAYDPLVQQALAATRAFGIQPVLGISSTDANLPLSKGIPAVTMSRGGIGGNAHSPDEWWQNVQSYLSMQIGLVTLLAQAGLVEADP